MNKSPTGMPASRSQAGTAGYLSAVQTRLALAKGEKNIIGDLDFLERTALRPALTKEYDAIANYNATLATLEWAKGTILNYNNVQISEGALPQAAQVRAVEYEKERTRSIVCKGSPTRPGSLACWWRRRTRTRRTWEAPPGDGKALMPPGFEGKINVAGRPIDPLVLPVSNKYADPAQSMKMPTFEPERRPVTMPPAAQPEPLPQGKQPLPLLESLKREHVVSNANHEGAKAKETTKKALKCDASIPGAMLFVPSSFRVFAIRILRFRPAGAKRGYTENSGSFFSLRERTQHVQEDSRSFGWLGFCRARRSFGSFAGQANRRHSAAAAGGAAFGRLFFHAAGVE